MAEPVVEADAVVEAEAVVVAKEEPEENEEEAVLEQTFLYSKANSNARCNGVGHSFRPPHPQKLVAQIFH